MPNEHRLILDTHVWIWLINRDKRISPELLRKINKAAERSTLYISAISVWEVCILAMKERIVFSCPVNEWIKTATAAPGLITLPLSNEVCLESTQLPGDFHGDPANRIICASARLYRSLLLTADKQIIHYAKGNHLKLIAV